MCGIFGTLALAPGVPADRDAVAAMSHVLRHRGPDGHDLHVDGPLAMGARRLAIVDPAGGGQPAANEDGSVRVVLNGELYDLARLRAGLRRRGHELRGAGDAEVLAHLYEERGEQFVAGLRGMFAVAVWDGRERRLVLARDCFGVKPLLYALDGRRLHFASELRALLALGDVPRDLDPDALHTYLAINAVPAPRTMVRAVRRLPAGHMVVVQDGRAELRRHARVRPVPHDELRRDAAPALAAELRGRLADSVRAHLVADVRVGVLLSGGVDSGGVAALAARETGPGLPTFTIGFDEPSFDERAGARLIARRYGTDHHEEVLGATRAAELLARVAGEMDEPRGDATAVPYWLLARMASGTVKAALSGEGADELFGGYQTYVADVLGARGAAAAAALGPVVERWPSSSGRLGLDLRLRRLALGAGRDALERHHAYKEIFSAQARAGLVTPAWRSSADPLAAYRARFAETAGAPLLARLQDVDAGTFLADDLLTQADRAGMAHGLEVRVPYLDPVVAELALALPTTAKVRGLRTKALLRDALAPLLPRAVVRGPKRGFCSPAAAWLRGPLEPFAREVLQGPMLARQGVFRPGAVAAALDRHVARREDLSRPLWALLAFTLWHDAVLGAPAATIPTPETEEELWPAAR